MTTDIKAFGRLTGYTAENPGSVFGEIDDYIATFSLTEKSYKSQNHPTAEVLTFSALSTDKEEISLNTELRNYLLKFTAFIDSSVTGGLFNNSTVSAKDLIISSTAHFGDEFIMKKVGTMVSSGNTYCPSYVEFSLVGMDLESTVIIWFGKAAFKQQYPLYTIYPLCGISDLDKLHTSDAIIKNTLLTVNPTVMNNLEQKQIGEYPQTYINSSNYKVYSDEGTELGVLYLSGVIYGPAGNNTDVLREEYINFILKNSTYDREAWEVRVPDLFIKTEYIIVPRWDVTGLPNNGTAGAMYRSMINMTTTLDMIEKYTSGLTRVHINQYGDVGVGRYKSVMIGAIGAPTNRNGIYSLGEQWPYFGNLSTTGNSNDYSRYDEPTKEFITRLVTMLEYAENIDNFISFKEGYSKVTRDAFIYITTTINNIQYLVLCKKTMVPEEE